MDDAELLNLVTSEHRRSIGFDLDAELVRQREEALEYYKGEMRDLPAMDNRSKAVSMDVRDGIQSVLPDLLEIFTGGDDVVTFQPIGPEDEEAARQETDYLRSVVFDENDGWGVFNSVILDALQAKTGVFKWWVEEGDQPEDEKFEGKTAVELQMAQQSGCEVIDVKLCDDQDEAALAGEPLYDFTLRHPQEDGAIKIASVSPEDITVAKDTVRLKDATYCATRSRPRAQDLIKQGIDPDLVDELPEWQATINNAVPQARDTVFEGQQVGGGTTREMRQVEVFEHFIRIRDTKGEKIWCVLTGGPSAPVLLRKQEVNQIQLSAVTPFTVSHRFYGNSLADMLTDIQRIKSQLQRMTLDSGYFALNQRSEVADDKSNANTLADLLRNEPGVPIRVRQLGAIAPVPASGLTFNALEHLEYFSTVGEERTGIIRGAQGLNPDTLHETKGGMLAQLARAQKRIRMIARTMAETGVKDMFLGVHALLRENASKSRIKQIRGKWVEVNPSQWAARKDMRIEIGLGSGGRDYDVALMEKIIGLQEQAVTAQGGLDGPLVTAQHLYNAASTLVQKAGSKQPEEFFQDPSKLPPPDPNAAPPPDPAVQEAQAKMQLEQMRMQADQQINAAKMQADQQMAQAKLQMDQQISQADLALKREQLAQELQLKREQLSAELQLKREQMQAELTLKVQMPDGGTDIGRVDVGGEPG